MKKSSVVILHSIRYSPNLGGNGLDWLTYLGGNSQTTPTIQNTFALAFLTHYCSYRWCV